MGDSGIDMNFRNMSDSGIDTDLSAVVNSNSNSKEGSYYQLKSSPMVIR